MSSLKQAGSRTIYNEGVITQRSFIAPNFMLENLKMSDYVLSCCSTAEMPLEHFQKKNIPMILGKPYRHLWLERQSGGS